jgi:cupin domain
MRKSLMILVLTSALALAQTTAAPKKATAKAPAPAGVIVTPDKIQWGPAPPVMQPGAKAAVIAGNPMGAGPFIIRLKMPDGYKIMPHWHPTAETVTILSGEFRVAMGDKWDDSKLVSLPTHSVAVVPPHHTHYAVAKGETEVQVSGMGPFKINYVNPADDPSKKK